MYIVIYLVFMGAQLNEYLHTCRKREAEYELSKYSEEKDEVWDDDDIEDTDELKSVSGKIDKQSEGDIKKDTAEDITEDTAEELTDDIGTGEYTKENNP